MSVINTSKSLTCLLDSILSKLLTDVFPSVTMSTMVKYSLLTRYEPQAFKVAIIKPFFSFTNLDPAILPSCPSFYNPPFISKILDKAVAKQLCDHQE